MPCRYVQVGVATASLGCLARPSLARLTEGGSQRTELVRRVKDEKAAGHVYISAVCPRPDLCVPKTQIQAAPTRRLALSAALLDAARWGCSALG